MQQFSKKTVAMIVLAILVIGGVVFGGWKCWEGKNIHIITTQNQNGLDDGTTDAWLNDVKDYIDGEYVFESMDTSDWKTFRNDKVGYEIKIPRDWSCLHGENSLDENLKISSSVCKKNKKINKDGNDDSWIKLRFSNDKSGHQIVLYTKDSLVQRISELGYIKPHLLPSGKADIQYEGVSKLFTAHIDGVDVIVMENSIPYVIETENEGEIVVSSHALDVFNPRENWSIELYAPDFGEKKVFDAIIQSFHFIK